MTPTSRIQHVVHVALGIVLPVVFLAVGGALFWLANKPMPPKVPAMGADPASLLSVMPAAHVQRVRALTEPLDITASGVVVPFREIALAAEVAGRIIEKDASVRHGNHVHQGQVLLKIDPRDYQLDVDRLAQRLEQERVILTENEQELENIGKLVEVAAAQFALAEADFKRTEDLGQGFASPSELGAAKQAVLTALNQKVTLENQLSTLRTRGQRLELAIKLGETEMQQAQLNLERTQIRSPVDGIIAREQVEADSYVQRGTSLMTIEDVSKAEIACSLRMDQLYWILDQGSNSQDRNLNASLATLQKLPKIDAHIRFSLAGKNSVVYEWDGRLDRIEGSGLDPQSRMVPIRIVVDNPREYRINGQQTSDTSMALVRGMFVDVVLKAKPATQLLLVPKPSVKPATDAYRIWKFEPDPVAFQVVRQRNGLSEPQVGDTSEESNERLDRPTLVAERGGEEATQGEGARGSNRPDPMLWEAGFLKVIEGVDVLGNYAGSVGMQMEYLICDARHSEILPGDFVVVTPIPGIETRQEPIRVAKEDFQDEQVLPTPAIPTNSSTKNSTEAEPASNLQ